MQRTAWILAMVFLVTGCQRGGEKPTASKERESKRPSEVAQAGGIDSDDPSAVQNADYEGNDSESSVSDSPEQLVKKFVGALRAGDARTVSNLLTEKARYETRRHGLEVKPQLFPTSDFEVEETQFASERKDIAYVGCRWLETKSSAQAFEIVWVAKRQDEGWRISGLATPLVAGATPKLLNFENVEEMLAIMESAAEGRAEERVSRAVK